MPGRQAVEAEEEVAETAAELGLAQTAFSVAGTVGLGTVANPGVGLDVQVESVLAVPLVELRS